jgi:hypothetical protein
MEIPATKLRAITSKQVDQTKPASIVINKFGGLTKFCQLTGFPTSTAHAWTIRGYIPPHGRGDQRSISYHAQILAVARENNIPLSGTDFVDQPVEAIAANG